MDTLSCNEALEENNKPTVKTGGTDVGFGAFLKAAKPNMAIVGDVMVMLAIAIFAWFVWCQVFSYLWPTGPALFITPGLWLFIGASTIARIIWNILFLCPKVP